jgi:hypothetical protein
MPNTYTLKLTGMPLLIRIQNGIGFVRLFFTETLTILILSTVDLIFGFHKRKLLLYIIVLFTILYQIFIGGDGWAYWRLLSPAVPLLLVLFIHAAHILLSTISDTEIFRAYFLRNPVIPRRFVANSFLILFLLVELTLAQRRFLPEVFFIQRPYLVNSNKGLVNIAIAIDQLTTRDATVGVVSAGVIPYFTGRKAIDFLGKSDRYIARLPPDLSGNVGWAGMTSVPGHNKYDLKYSIKTLLPTYVQRFAWGDVDLSQWGLTRYTAVEYYNGVTVFLLMDSPAVYWEKVKSP